MVQRDSKRKQSETKQGRSAQTAAADELRLEPLPDDDVELQLEPLDGVSEPDARIVQNSDGDALAVMEEIPFEPAPISAAETGGQGVSEAESKGANVPADLATANAQDEDLTELEDLQVASARRKFFLTAAPSWLISLLVHVGLILVLAAVTLDPLQSVVSVLQASAAEVEPKLDEFDIQGPTLESMGDLPDDPLSMPAPTLGEVVSMPELASPMVTSFDVNLDSLELNTATESIMPSALLKTSTLAQMNVALNSRSASVKSEMLEKFGGNAASEKAVALALKWLATHQAPDGGWSFAHSAFCRNQCGDAGDLALARNGATAMALLPFLGAGQTHLEGQYKTVVKRGLAYLINRLKVANEGGLPTGSWHESGGQMYSHGLAAITICEAYAMTADPDLVQPAQLSLNYLVYAQSEQDGGWRYRPKSRGDTSVVGWCLMALKSGKMGRLSVPNSTFQAADRFLDYVSTNQGAYYGYDKPTANIDGRRATIAVGLLCRMYLGYPKEHPGLQEGVKYLGETGPKLNDLYYTYYATQVMRHHGGEVWENWNTELRDDLVEAQIQSGHAAGSWFTGGSHSEKGGRLYATSLATMILEVYYRHMPLYSDRSSDDDFEI